MNTTLKKIKAHGPCADGWKKLLAYLGKTEADDEPLSLLTILDSNGLDDALWALRAVDGYDKEIRLLACDYAERVLPIYESQYPEDSRVRDCITTARRYAISGVSEKELVAACDAARAACDAARAAGAPRAARAAAGAVRLAAGDARLAAGDARLAAGDARAAEMDWQTERLIDLLTALQADKSIDTENTNE